jgi:hypothetical protein
MIIGKTQNGGAVGFHGLKVSAVQQRLWMAVGDK